MSSLLRNEQVQAAFDWLHEHSDRIGAARGMVIRLEYKVKRVLARKMLAASGPEWQRKAEATCDPEYESVCEAHADAEATWEELRDTRNKCELILEAWRTLSANDRGIRKVG